MRINQLFQIFFYFFCFTIPLNQFVNVRVLIATLIISLFVTPQQALGHLRKSWDIFFYILILAVGLTYSEDLPLGFRLMETSFSFLALPIIMNRFSYSKDFSFDNYFKTFSYGLLLACFICLTNACFQFAKNADFSSFFFYEFTTILNFHPTYFAYYIIFAITYYLYGIFYKNSNFRIARSVAVVSFLFLILLLTGGKTTFVCLLLVFSFFILKFLVEQRTTHRTYVIILILTMLSCLFAVSYFEGSIRAAALNDSWDRLILWESTFEAAPNILFGVGTGDYKLELNNYYNTHQLSKYANESMNSHNQIIQLLFSNGILGALAFIFLIARPIYLAVKGHNMLAVLVFFPFIIYGITEVFLGRYQGVVFFVWLHEMFVVAIRNDTQKILEMVSFKTFNY